ncbi:hypothetical protein BJN45_13585 [Azonexus hydrophilus]|uniref:diguanylate cyclase n=1 Tax=Azonexus hydrophilus TaxID=418702 RepID=A0A1R1I0Q8_9RHOO|nr:diguanylate cyclase [Azonexus hydrophilus]OMG52342.1 hypothetical protein BJN45_13585 [Azonexus hydrophilus]
MPTRVLPRSFRNLLVVVFGLLTLVVGLPLYLYSSSIHRDQLIADRQENLHSLAMATATVLAENLIERRREIELLAQTTAFRTEPLDSPNINAGLDRLKRSYQHYSWIGLTDTAGRIRAATGGQLVGIDAAARPWFEHGRHGVHVGDLHEAKLLAKLLSSEYPGQVVRFIDFASPVYDDAGNLRGVLAAHAHWQWAGYILRAVVPLNAAEDAIEVFIVSRDDQIIYPEGGFADTRVPARGSNGKQADGFQDWGGVQPYLTAAHAVAEPSGDTLGWRVVVRQPRDVVLAGVAELQRVILLTTLVALVVFLIFAWIGAARVSRPLAQLTDIARRIERGDEHVDFAVSVHTQELQCLSQALGGMAQTLMDQKSALLAANHELEDKVAERTAELSRLNAELQLLARTDALTGLANRMFSNERLAEEFVRFRRTGVAYALMIMDIDYFKKVNDTWGHPAGDAVLRHVAGLLRSTLRASDFVGRVGGEEFMVILPATDLEQAARVAEKIRSVVEATPIAPAGTVTLSIGVHVPTLTDADEEAALHVADRLLYAAKQGGRNRVVFDAGVAG